MEERVYFGSWLQRQHILEGRSRRTLTARHPLFKRHKASEKVEGHQRRFVLAAFNVNLKHRRRNLTEELFLSGWPGSIFMGIF